MIGLIRRDIRLNISGINRLEILHRLLITFAEAVTTVDALPVLARTINDAQVGVFPTRRILLVVPLVTRASLARSLR